MSHLNRLASLIREALRRAVGPGRGDEPRAPSRRAQQAEVLALARLGRYPPR